MAKKRAIKHKHFVPQDYQPELVAILKYIEQEAGKVSPVKLQQVLRMYPKDGKGYFSKSQLIEGYRTFAGRHGLKPLNAQIISRLQMKPVRTMSGVTPITVLNKPFPCPGKCIFCPNDVKMPKSYLSDEPGAQRAERNLFDPYLQTYNRLQALHDIGHQVDKAELIVLGGTWSFYPTRYQIWFIKRLFEALSDFGEGIDKRALTHGSLDVSHVTDSNQGLVRTPEGMSSTYNQAIADLYKDQEIPKLKLSTESATWEELELEHQRNSQARIRSVGLVLETRPDYISAAEIVKLRRFGTTKVQIGLQSLQDKVLTANKRGHAASDSSRAINLLRQAGFKIHAHWMPNLYGSSVAADKLDYRKLFADPGFKPDEIKIYPCSLIDDTELMSVYEKGEWHPYTHQELLDITSYCLTHTPQYCRITRVVRDIPSTDIVKGNKKTNFRQIAAKHNQTLNLAMQDIRAREIGNTKVSLEDVELNILCYKTDVSIEYFLQYVTRARKHLEPNQICAFLRLSIPTTKELLEELARSSIIREVHVYGPAVAIGHAGKDKTQHMGLGKKLINTAEKIALEHGFSNIAVISAVGTREYYEKLGYCVGSLYQHKTL
jgi:elongator complex protein 3